MGNLPIGQEKVDKWYRLEASYEPSDLNEIPKRYCADTKKSYLLREEALKNLLEMLDKANNYNAKEFTIKCISAYRSYEYQKELYKKAQLKRGKEQNVVAKPGHSEHQLGVTVDISSTEVDYAIDEGFAKTKAYKWLLANAARYGFEFSYTKENHETKGYTWEPWHLRYTGKKVLN